MYYQLGLEVKMKLFWLVWAIFLPIGSLIPPLLVHCKAWFLNFFICCGEKNKSTFGNFGDYCLGWIWFNIIDNITNCKFTKSGSVMTFSSWFLMRVIWPITDLPEPCREFYIHTMALVLQAHILSSQEFYVNLLHLHVG